MRIATTTDLPQMLAVLDSSFTEDPHIAWFIGSPSDPTQASRRRTALMRVLCQHALTCDQAFVSEDLQAVALWQHSDRHPRGWAYVAAELGFFRHCGLAASIRSMAMEAESARRRPSYPHRFLWTIGISAEARGKGLFGSLVRPILGQADADGIEVWLETTVPRNVEIYRHYGFEVEAKYRYKDSPEIILMRRGVAKMASAPEIPGR
jgi:GNAT superfamily N-acetyltransferase